MRLGITVAQCFDEIALMKFFKLTEFNDLKYVIYKFFSPSILGTIFEIYLKTEICCKIDSRPISFWALLSSDCTLGQTGGNLALFTFAATLHPLAESYDPRLCSSKTARLPRRDALVLQPLVQKLQQHDEFLAVFAAYEWQHLTAKPLFSSGADLY
jgi:hypothetical protein